MMTSMHTVHLDGFCPMGCGPTLVIGIANPIAHDAGRVVCDSVSCPRPSAASEVLADQETEHVVTMALDGFTLRHPLRERLDDALLSCTLHLRLNRGYPSDVAPGLYRVTSHGGTWTWERVE